MKRQPTWVHGLACLTAGTFFCATPVVAGTQGSIRANETRLVITGVVCHVERDGGYYFIRSDDEKDYDPGASLPEEFRKPNLRVRIEGKVLEGVPAFRMWGEVVEIRKIEAVTPSPPDKDAAAEQGVAGKVVKLTGNFMPSPEPRRGANAKKPLSVPVHIFKGQLKVFEKPNTEHPAFVRKIQADADGNFRCVLPPGEYTVVAEINGKLYLNSFTPGDKGSLYWSTVKIEKQKWTTFNIEDSSGAVF